MDGRGMAVKILEPPSLGLSSPPVPGKGPAAAATTHDILMINYPVFFSPDAVDYAGFAKSGALTGDSSGLRRYFVPSFINPLRWRVRQGLIAYNIASQKIFSPLAIQYFSMVPFLFSPGRAVKYSARPCQAAPEQRRASDSSGPDFLRAIMQEDLSRGPACFELMVQERQSGMPIEDATVEWSQSASSFRRVGVISIQQQQFQTPERTTFCESTAFTPWNASPDHRPLGSTNRVRKVLYEKISSERHNRNSAPSPDPLVAWERL